MFNMQFPYAPANDKYTPALETRYVGKCIVDCVRVHIIRRTSDVFCVETNESSISNLYRCHFRCLRVPSCTSIYAVIKLCVRCSYILCMKSLIAYRMLNTRRIHSREWKNMKTKSLRSSAKPNQNSDSFGSMVHVFFSLARITLSTIRLNNGLVWNTRRMHLKLNRCIYEYGKWMRWPWPMKKLDKILNDIRWSVKHENRQSIAQIQPAILSNENFRSQTTQTSPFNANEFIAPINRNFWGPKSPTILLCPIPFRLFIDCRHPIKSIYVCTNKHQRSEWAYRKRSIKTVYTVAHHSVMNIPPRLILFNNNCSNRVAGDFQSS